MFRRRNTNQQIITGAIIGGALGSMLTFLFTPKSGRELRTDIKNNIDTSMDKVKNTSGKLFNNAKTMSNDFVEKWQAAINAGINTYKMEAQKIKTSKEIIEENLAGGVEQGQTTEQAGT
jgi:gas vesicle protein